MRHPWANTLLLALLLLQLGTGLGALLSGREAFRWILWLHGIGGYGLSLLLWWKGAIILHVLRRGRWTMARVAFLLMTLLLLLILGSGYYWTSAGPLDVGGYSLMVMHGTLAALLLLPLLWHLLARRWILRVPASRDRRVLFRLLGAGLAGALLWRAGEWLKGTTSLQGRARRFTGSYEQGSGTGRFPQVSWLFDRPSPLEAERWALDVGGAVEHPLRLTLADLARLPQEEAIETLDCTGGWYTTQVWRGVRVEHLLEEASPLGEARAVIVESVTGYNRRFGLAEAGEYLLAMDVAGAPLEHGHGAPLRLVARGNRGYDWVKWIVRLTVTPESHLLQPPLPLR